MWKRLRNHQDIREEADFILFEPRIDFGASLRYPKSLYKTSENYSLDTLHILKDEEIGDGGCGNIYRGTITRSYGVQHRLYRGVWEGKNFLSSENSTRFNPSTLVEETVTVAVKTIRSSDDKLLELIREASNARTLQGMRNVASVYGVSYNKEMDCPCVVMELVEGPDLNSFLRSGRKFAADACWSWWKTKLQIFMELVIGLSVCHKREVYHGDLKGKNVLINRFGVPKLIDFGFSFRKRDVEYLRSLGGSPFWISPELADVVDEVPPEVLENPYPCDVYSLGMVLVEIWIDGDIPEFMNSSLTMNKFLGGSPVELVVPEGMEDVRSSVFDELLAVVDGCSASDRGRRITLEQCLVKIQAAYSGLCSKMSRFAASRKYQDMVAVVQARFPGVPDAILQQPAKNLMVNSRGTLLVDLFCVLDFEQPVKFIIEARDWEFNPMVEVPRLAWICVRQDSPRVLKFLGERWRTILQQEELLVHMACRSDSLETLRVLVEDIGMEFDTWFCEEQYKPGLKPIHMLAIQGNVEMMKFLLSKATTKDYVNTTTIRWRQKTALDYAIERDKPEAVFFLVGSGGVVRKAQVLKPDVDFLVELFYCAMSQGSLRVATRLLEVSFKLKGKGGGLIGNVEISQQVLQRFQVHGKSERSCLDYFGDKFRDEEYVLSLLQNHLAESERRGVDPVKLAKVDGDNNKTISELLHSFCKNTGYPPSVLEHKLAMCMGFKLFVPRMTGDEDLQQSAVEQGDVGRMEFLNILGHVEHLDEQSGELIKDNEDNKGQSSRNVEGSDGKEVYRELLISQVCDAIVQQAGTSSIKQKLQKLCRQSSAISAVDAWNPEESLQGIELVIELKTITEQAADIWTDIAYNLLRTAAQYGNEDLVQHLLEIGVPVNRDHADGWDTETPLMGAVTGQNLKLVERILLAGADPNARTREGKTCMDIALKNGGNRKLVRLLIKFGFDTGTKNTNNETYMDLIANL